MEGENFLCYVVIVISLIETAYFFAVYWMLRRVRNYMKEDVEFISKHINTVTKHELQIAEILAVLRNKEKGEA